MTTSTDTAAGLLDRFIDTDQLKKDLAINVANISESLANQTQLFVHYAMATVRAKRQYERWKTALEVLEASLDSTYRRQLMDEASADGKEAKKNAVTEPKVLALIRQDAKWKAASSRVIDAQEIFRLCEAAERAFEHRREMVKRIAEDQAREHEGSLRVMRNQDGLSARDRLLSTMQAGASAAGGSAA